MTKKALYVDDLRDLPENTDEYTHLHQFQQRLILSVKNTEFFLN